MGNGDHGFQKISRISRVLIYVNLRHPLKSVIGNGFSVVGKIKISV